MSSADKGRGGSSRVGWGGVGDMIVGWGNQGISREMEWEQGVWTCFLVNEMQYVMP